MSLLKNNVFGFVDRNPFMKNLANRRVRRTSVETDIASGKANVKLLNRINIEHSESTDVIDRIFVPRKPRCLRRGFS